MGIIDPVIEARLNLLPWLDAGRCPKCRAILHEDYFIRVFLPKDSGYNPYHRSVVRVQCRGCRTQFGDVDVQTYELLSHI